MFVIFREIIFIFCFALVAGIAGFLIYGTKKGWQNIHLEESRKNE